MVRTGRIWQTLIAAIPHLRPQLPLRCCCFRAACSQKHQSRSASAPLSSKSVDRSGEKRCRTAGGDAIMRPSAHCPIKQQQFRCDLCLCADMRGGDTGWSKARSRGRSAVRNLPSIRCMACGIAPGSRGFCSLHDHQNWPRARGACVRHALQPRFSSLEMANDHASERLSLCTATHTAVSLTTLAEEETACLR